ncbi:IclR family transcriptional regulator [Actinomadura pelletieri DSM 43383]|uniref:IclR family transcriptional regulator n=1 Tax=Actinomadura pelletieri DSM 43383 TaxID=1120940 RepID=A0A495QA75_9ACTN|nr:IclR family transcriptional regulator C-terminal domain-containing protein [Actinomadura pelletieri]RKS68410.1 IclR family transcriptional regulator [Actinomadura pelletieri DSM 43383]
MQEVGPLKRGLEILEVVGRAGGPLRPADLVAESGLARSTVDRVLSTLTETGRLRWQGRDVVATPQAMDVGNLYLSGLDPEGLLAARVARLAEELGETVLLGVPDRDGVRVVSQSRPGGSLAIAVRVGDLLPLGPSPDDEFIEPGLVAVTTSVRAAAGPLVLVVVGHAAASLHERARPAVAACVADLERIPTRPSPPNKYRARGTDGDTKARLGAQFLQSLDRGLAVLHAIGTRADGLTISETAAVTGQPRATARRALLSLTSLGYARESEGRFVLLPRVLDLGYRQVSGLSFDELARPHLRDLVLRVHDSASVVVLDGTDIRYVARAQAVRLMRVEITVGTRFPAYATAMGRVLLAELPQDEASDLIARSDRRAFTARTLTAPAELERAVSIARDDGYAVVDQELEMGLRSIAVPIHAAGRTVAALNIAAPAAPEPVEAMRDRLLPELRATARDLEADVAAFTRHQPLPL